MSLMLYRARAAAEAPVGRLATLLLEAVRQHVQADPGAASLNSPR